MSVCLPISKMTCSHFIKFSVHITCGLAMARFSDSDAICDVLLVLWMTSCLSIISKVKVMLVGRIYRTRGEIMMSTVVCFGTHLLTRTDLERGTTFGHGRTGCIGQKMLETTDLSTAERVCKL